MSSRFEPHDYAVHLASLAEFAQEDGTLYEWTGTHWQALNENRAEKMAYHWLASHQREHASTKNAASAVGSALHWIKEVAKPTREIIVPCRNGYVHIEGGELKLISADPNLGMRHELACDYSATYEGAGRFRGFIEQVLPDAEVRARVQEYIGYTLTADARHQRAQLWIGGGANGKGVLANIVQALHGTPACVRLDELDGFGMSGLVGASLIYSDEVPRSHIDEQLLKSMIAGERVLVNRKYREPLSVRIRGKWLVLGNHLPTIGDHSTGFWRRWDVVPFVVTIPERERDPLLAEQIIEYELSAVLNWALEGLIRLQTRGAFDPVLPRAMAEILHDVKVESNVVKAWFEDCAVSSSSGINTKKEAVYEHFQNWCSRNGERAVASSKFWKELLALLQFKESRRREEGTFVRYCSIDLSSNFLPR